MASNRLTSWSLIVSLAPNISPHPGDVETRGMKHSAIQGIRRRRRIFSNYLLSLSFSLSPFTRVGRGGLSQGRGVYAIIMHRVSRCLLRHGRNANPKSPRRRLTLLPAIFYAYPSRNILRLCHGSGVESYWFSVMGGWLAGDLCWKSILKI